MKLKKVKDLFHIFVYMLELVLPGSQVFFLKTHY